MNPAEKLKIGILYVSPSSFLSPTATSAKKVLRQAFEAVIPATWAVADALYSTLRNLPGWLEEWVWSYVLAAATTQGACHKECQRQARTAADRLPEGTWWGVSTTAGSKDNRVYDCACVSLPDPGRRTKDQKRARAVTSNLALLAQDLEPDRGRLLLSVGRALLTTALL